MKPFLLIFGFLLCWPLYGSADQQVQARFEKSLKDARSLSNVEIEWLDELWMDSVPSLRGPNITPHTRTFQYSLIESGEKFRAACKLTATTTTNLGALDEAVFDGKMFSTYSADTRHMTKRSMYPEGSGSESDYNPLIAPFMFLTRRSDSCMRCVLRFSDIKSEGFAEGLTLPVGQRTDGFLEIAMPGLPLLKHPTTWKIVIDESGDSFTPKSIERIFPAIGKTVISRLLDYTNLGAYWFPSRIEWEEMSYPATSPPTLLSTGLVTLISARIREDIPDSVFKLDSEEKDAKVIWDWDQNKLKRSDPGAIKVLAANNTARTSMLLLIVFTTLVIPIGMMFLKKIASKTK
jgi:hypothetical protein